MGWKLLMALQYRVAQPADAEQIAALHADSWRRTYRGILSDHFLDGDVLDERKRVWAARLTAPRHDQLVLVAEDAGVTRAFICVYGVEDPNWGSLIDNLHVHFELQGAGLGSALLREAALWVQARFQNSAIYLWVMENNRAAQLFYERRGAVNCGSMIRETPEGGAASCIRYAWVSPALLIARCAADLNSA